MATSESDAGRVKKMTEQVANSPHDPFALSIENGGTVFLVRHIFTGTASLQDVYLAFLSRKIDDLNGATQ